MQIGIVAVFDNCPLWGATRLCGTQVLLGHTGSTVGSRVRVTVACVTRLYTVGRKPLYEFADTGWRIRINSYDR